FEPGALERASAPAARPDLRDLDLAGLEAFVERLGEKRFRARQLHKWIHQRGARSFEQMSDLSKDLRARLTAEATLGTLEIDTKEKARDGTRKWLFRFRDGNEAETVYIPDPDEPRDLFGMLLRCEAALV
ncbi:MAG: hypothetical protein ACK4OI_18235, partial [Rhizobium oryzihabitans]